MAVSPLIWTVF